MVCLEFVDKSKEKNGGGVAEGALSGPVFPLNFANHVISSNIEIRR